MIKIGKRQKLIINNFSKVGAYLDAGTEDPKDNILLPNNELENRELNVGDEVDVLIYKDSEDRPIATFRITEALVGTITKLEVIDINKNLGAFLYWGLNKDILLPNNQQTEKVKIGEKYLVGIYEDSKGRISATMKLNNFLLPAPEEIKKNDTVTGTVYGVNEELGIFVAVEDRYFGLIPNNEYFKSYNVGDEVTARVIRIREDNKIDLSERQLSYIQMDKDAELILEKMKLLKNSFRFNDKSSPEDIEAYFGISKKAFKRAIGALLKAEKIEKTDKGFQIKN
ncbi:MAG: S1 RNA-binding domain-containing protein [Fusobacteriaceae bacterium]|jgi:predicted RNA-binding protein (virulence factor B family)|nr:S1 RNA-binding domain-containing protein [Fusobacteriaceae bacterium]